MALAMAGAIEGAHMGHPDFRAKGRIFATLTGNGKMGMVALTPEQQEAVDAAMRRRRSRRQAVPGGARGGRW